MYLNLLHPRPLRTNKNFLLNHLCVVTIELKIVSITSELDFIISVNDIYLYKWSFTCFKKEYIALNTQTGIVIERVFEIIVCFRAPWERF